MSPPLTGKQRRYLRAEAHGLRPVVQIGKHGVSEAVLAQIDRGLAAHELIKVQYVAEKWDKDSLSSRVEETFGARCAGVLGHILIFYREHAEPEKRRFQLPD